MSITKMTLVLPNKEVGGMMMFRHTNINSVCKFQFSSKAKEINQMHSALKFTCERENNNSIPFLDVKH